ncbi:hypothetical protein [Paenibacillus contaminans]|uniref:hypothetical protein n=1 Tax=Paenibacillus contaminans TaxID=450362 RepID=UPI001314AC1C|nr:hypothetical protein [Paenibacillus contaminans]
MDRGISVLDLFRSDQGKTALEYPHFPTPMQAVVWRNWGMVPVERIAKLLKASPEQVTELAEGLGLPAFPEVDPLWLSRGYITLIRANWHLLTYEQLLVLLAWTADQLAFALKEDDFLWIKLGSLKPARETIYYRPLTGEEQGRTAELRRQLARHFPADVHPILEKPFGFLSRFAGDGDRDKRMFATETVISLTAGDSAHIRLDSGWRVCYPAGGKHIRTFADRFILRMKQRWGIEMTACQLDPEQMAAGTQPRTVHLVIRPDDSLLAESHAIEVSTHAVTIQAVDEPGLLKGLQWITKRMEEYGGPLLKRGRTQRKTKMDLRFIYSYFAVFGDPLIDPEVDPYPDALLESLSELGVNGVWLHTVLYNLVPWDAAPELSVHWEKRLDGLRRLTERAAEYGIGVYLYFNEPREMPLSFFERYPEWKGHSHDGIHAVLCTSHPDIQHYLRSSTARLFTEVPELAGLFTITKSENVTHCYSHANRETTTCARCREREPIEVVAELNRCITEGAFSAKPDAKLICYTWAWTEYEKETLIKGISSLPDGMRVMCVSEELMPTHVADTQGYVRDYSISIVGPGERSRISWEAAAARGLQTVAKVQFNNSWECSAVPYLPVLDLIEEHLNGLLASGVTGLMLSWTLGGYPSPNLELASEYYWETSAVDSFASDATVAGAPTLSGKTELLKRKFGEAAEPIAAAIGQMSEAFRQFPFHIVTVYTGPQNSGPTNLLYLAPTGYKATMIGFPYDDLSTWKNIYTAERFERQFQLLAQQWKAGLDQLTEAEAAVSDGRQEDYTELLHTAMGAYYHFRSTAMQISFVIARDRFLQEEDAKERERLRSRLIELVEEELELAKLLYALICRDSRIGYEATNHYYYRRQDIQEKVLNCLHVQQQLSGGIS